MSGERPPHEQGAGVLRFRSVWGGGANRRRQAHEQEPSACGAGNVGGRCCRGPAVPAAGATADERRAPAPRAGGGRSAFSFRLGRRREQTAAGSRAGAFRLRAGQRRRPELPRAGGAWPPELPRMSGERPPHEQGVGVLRFRFRLGAEARTDGGRLTSRSLPPAGRQCRSRSCRGPAVPAAGATADERRAPAPRAGGGRSAFSFRLGRRREQTAAGSRAGAFRLRPATSAAGAAAGERRRFLEGLVGYGLRVQRGLLQTSVYFDSIHFKTDRSLITCGLFSPFFAHKDEWG